jgi:hypothetical protein
MGADTYFLILGQNPDQGKRPHQKMFDTFWLKVGKFWAGLVQNADLRMPNPKVPLCWGLVGSLVRLRTHSTWINTPLLLFSFSFFFM